MSERGGEVGDAGAGRPMSRGEFLGTGAALALAAAACDTPPPEVTDQGQRVRPASIGQSTPAAVRYEWAIPAGILNALWSDVFPRLVAKAWLKESDYEWVWPGMTEEDLIESLWRFHVSLGGRASTPASGTDWSALRVAAIQIPLGFRNVPQGLSLRKRLQTVAEYFEREHSARFLISGRGGYDFLLSEWGIEFFFPPQPETAADILRYYSFRNTGRPTIGLPLYMQSGMSSVDTDAPTGPSQVLASPELMQERIRVDAEAYGANMARPARLQLLRERLSSRRNAAQGSEREDVQATVYTCSKHSWYVEGTVYRGMMVELPRIVAVAWMEIEDKIDGGVHSYAKHIWEEGQTGPSARAHASGSPNGLRTLFEQRLETSLSPEMAFAFHPQTPPPNLADIWDADDVMISHSGLWFPTPPKLSGDVRTKLLTEIAEGRAGNPVFTDSKRPDGDE